MKIIILDDNFGIADALRIALQRLGNHDVSVVTRQQDLVEEVKRFVPDAIVFDFLLPGNGIDALIKEVNRMGSSIFYIFFSLYANDAIKRKKMKKLCEGDERRIIQKEPDLLDCAARILSVLESHVGDSR